MDNLREHVMINQFVLAAGCPREQAAQALAQAGWQFQTALSIYFQEAAIPKNNAGLSLLTPANTPATPPNFPDALTMLSNLSTSDKMATSPATGASAFSPCRHVSCSPHQSGGVSPYRPGIPNPPVWGATSSGTSGIARGMTTPQQIQSHKPVNSEQCPFPMSPDNGRFICQQKIPSVNYPTEEHLGTMDIEDEEFIHR